MISDGIVLNNVERFSGFENDYDKYRPEAPSTVVEILLSYLGKRPSCVMDLGCGTGLSSFIWTEHADQIIGVEPNPDMRRKAIEKLERRYGGDTAITFVQGFSNQLEAVDGTVDLITCSQSFHWMEPVSTLNEAARVLKSGGIFAAYDCDWPPTLYWDIEERYIELIERADAILSEFVAEKNKVKKWNKDDHLRHIQDSKLFRFAKEIVFHNKESCDAGRYVGLAISQGSLQTVLKLDASAINEDIQSFSSQVEDYFQGRTLEILFSYRMRLGIK